MIWIDECYLCINVVMSSVENDSTQSSISDGVIEVIGIISSFHMAQLQVYYILIDYI